MIAIAAASLDDAAGVELTGRQPKPTTLTPGQEEATLQLWESPDGKTSAGVRACTPGVFTLAREGFPETCHILAGQGTLHGDDGSSVPLRAGVLVALPEGWRGRWETTESPRKVYTIAMSQRRVSLSPRAPRLSPSGSGQTDRAKRRR